MATQTVYVQLKEPTKVRAITATNTDITWVFGRRTTMTIMFQSAAVSTFASTHTIETIIHEVEYATGGTTPVTETTSVAAFAAVNATSSTAATLPNYDSANIQILDTQVMDYVRFTGTGLPTAGLYFDTTTVSGIFNVAPTGTDSL